MVDAKDLIEKRNIEVEKFEKELIEFKRVKQDYEEF
jgi:hypothetical protein